MVASATPSEASPAPATGSAEDVSPVFGAFVSEDTLLFLFVLFCCV